MATETARQTYRGTITENGTLTVTGRGKCRVKVVGNIWDSGVLTILDDVHVGDGSEFKPVDIDGSAISINSGQRTWYLEGYHPSDEVSIRLNMASVASASDVDVYVSFDFPPAIPVS